MIIGIPTMNVHRGVEKCLSTLPQECEICIINNGTGAFKYYLLEPFRNATVIQSNIQNRQLGVAGAWNTIIRLYPSAYEWIFLNDDFMFCSQEDYRKFIAFSNTHFNADIITTKAGFACFILRPSAISKIGYFDENFYPAYYEDCDYMYRAKLCGASVVECPDINYVHHGSTTIKNDPKYDPNTFPFPFCREYYIAKWGGDKGHEIFTKPFNI